MADFINPTTGVVHIMVDGAMPDASLGLRPLTSEDITAQKAEQGPTTNVPQFIADVKSALGGILGANKIAVAYPLFFAAVQALDWSDVQAIILDAKATSTITSDEYTAIKESTATNNIPIILT